MLVDGPTAASTNDVVEPNVLGDSSSPRSKNPTFFDCFQPTQIGEVNGHSSGEATTSRMAVKSSQIPTVYNVRPAYHLPTLYVFNAAALSKPGAVDHLATDLKNTGAGIAVISLRRTSSRGI